MWLPPRCAIIAVPCVQSAAVRLDKSSAVRGDVDVTSVGAGGTGAAGAGAQIQRSGQNELRITDTEIRAE